MFYLPFKNYTNPVKENGKTIVTYYFGYGFIPKHSFVFPELVGKVPLKENKIKLETNTKIMVKHQ